MVLISPDRSRLRYAIRLHFSASNNVAEYEALINGLRIAIDLGAMGLYVRGDSELVVDQVMKESSYKSPLMEAYCQEVCKLEDKFQGIELHHVPQKDNDATDFLAKLAARRIPSPDGVFINDLHVPSACILEGPIQTHPNANLALGGSDPGASIMMSSWWHSIKLTGERRCSPTSLRKFSHPKGMKHDGSVDPPRHSSHSVMNFTSKVHRGYS